MSFFDDASLVMIPSGYKDQKIYSVKPTDGTGDLTFSRASSATRVQSDGLIEKVRTNVAAYSEQFDNAYWVKTNTTVVANSGIAPNGTTTAELVYPTTTGSNRLLEKSFSISASTPYTGTWHLKASGLSWVAIDHIDGNVGAWFNLSTGTIGTISAGSTASIENLGNGWYRCRVSKTSGGGSTGYHDIRLVDGDNVTSVTANGTDGLLVWGAQLETGDIATDYIATTTAAVSVGPVSGLPRLDYLGSTCPRLLLEPQRTNIFQYSEQVDNAYWDKVGSVTVTANNAVSPDGYQNADLVTAAAASVRIQRGFTGLTAGTRTLSCFAKAGTASGISINTYDGIVDKGASFNLSTGVVTGTSAGVTATITNYGSGWYRITHSYASAGTSYSCQFYFDAVGTYQVYGFQFEDSASYATSYIPTLGASVTRVADLCNKTSVSSLIGQTEGTIFAEVSFDDIGASGASSYIYITDGSFANSVIVGREPASPNSKFFFYIQANSVAILNNTTNNITSGVVKMAVAYKSGDWAAYLNGNLVASGSTTFTFNASMNRFAIGTNDGAQTIVGSSARAAQVLLFKTRLTNAQLAELTA